MYRFLWAAIGLAVVLPLVAAPVPKTGPDAPPLYFPTKVGAKWVSDGGLFPVAEVTAVEQKGKERAWVVTVSRFDKDGKAGPKDVWEVSEQGLFLIKDRGEPKETRQCFLRLPHRAGDKWQLVPEIVDFQCLSVKPQRVKVPAGEFEALGVEIYLGDSLFVTRWYAPGVGLVRIDDSKKKTSMTLKSFTPGKD